MSFYEYRDATERLSVVSRIRQHLRWLRHQMATTSVLYMCNYTRQIVSCGPSIFMVHGLPYSRLCFSLWKQIMQVGLSRNNINEVHEGNDILYRYPSRGWHINWCCGKNYQSRKVISFPVSIKIIANSPLQLQISRIFDDGRNDFFFFLRFPIILWYIKVVARRANTLIALRATFPIKEILLYGMLPILPWGYKLYVPLIGQRSFVVNVIMLLYCR